MDSITQIVVGIATVEALAGKELKNKSFLVGAILGTIPDLDIWIGKLFSYETELAFHRAFTHSILGILVLSPLFAFLLHRIWKQLSFKKWTMIVAATFATHILIDLFTSWGVQLLYPLPDRFSFKTIFVVDLFYTIPWIITLLFLYQKTDFFARLRYLKLGLLISTSYLLLTVFIKLYVSNTVAHQLKLTSLKWEDLIIKPTFSNCILWNVNIKTAEAYYIGSYSLLDSKPFQLTEYYKRDLAFEKMLMYVPNVNQLMEVSEYWFTINEGENESYVFNDLRFGTIELKDGNKQFAFSYKIHSAKDNFNIEPLPKTFRDGKQTLVKTWNRLKGN